MGVAATGVAVRLAPEALAQAGGGAEAGVVGLGAVVLAEKAGRQQWDWRGRGVHRVLRATNRRGCRRVCFTVRGGKFTAARLIRHRAMSRYPRGRPVPGQTGRSCYSRVRT